MKRAERRHEEYKRKKRIKKEVEAEVKRLQSIGVKFIRLLHRTSERVVGKRVNTPCQCSNPMCCGNPRRIVGRKVEKISELRKQKELDGVE